jgi:integrase
LHQNPEGLGAEDIRAYQVYLTNEKELAPESIMIATAALRFLYSVTLHKDWRMEAVLPIPRKPQTLPIVLSPEEVLHFLECVANFKQKTILTICYAAGLRISEAVSLKPTHIDSQRMVIRVEQGKGAKDRYVMLSSRLLEILRQVVATRQTERMAVPWRRARSTHHSRCDCQDVSRGSETKWPVQTRHAAFASSLWSAKIQSRTGGRERVFVMQSAKDGFGMDSVRFFATVARTGLLVVAERGRRIGNTRT